MNKAENSRCLLLNADYSPLKIISWKKAIVWSLRYENTHNYAIEIIEYYQDKYIQGACDKKYPVPLIAKTIKYFDIYNKSIKFSRNNLFLRDNYTCQYCGYIYSINQLTYDHIIPKSQWNKNSSPTTWTNIVTACRQCNAQKANRTPSQANMPLINHPYIPQKSLKYLPLYTELLTIQQDIPKQWLIYIQ